MAYCYTDLMEVLAAELHTVQHLCLHQQAAYYKGVT